MIRLSVHFTRGPTRGLRAVLLGVCLLLCLLLPASFDQIPAAAAEAESAPPPKVPIEPGRHYYLTDENFDTDDALRACSAGYHMASLWEILDTSNLIYDYRHAAAHVQLDSGHGPPSSWYGWIRTGFNSTSTNVAGAGNCRAWSSKAAGDYGTVARLSRTWTTAPGEIGQWDVDAASCGAMGPIWCVADLRPSFLPMIR